jgi:hypothetical protein
MAIIAFECFENRLGGSIFVLALGVEHYLCLSALSSLCGHPYRVPSTLRTEWRDRRLEIRIPCTNGFSKLHHDISTLARHGEASLQYHLHSFSVSATVVFIVQILLGLVTFLAQS